MNIELQLPVKDVMVNQYFGSEFWWFDKEKGKHVEFYKNLGMNSHNGIDFHIADKVTIVYAAHNGVIMNCGNDKGAGMFIDNLRCQGDGFKTVYYHLKEILVNKNQYVRAGQKIAVADNTGYYTTGAHLHFGLKRTDNGATIDIDNGWFGAIDPAPFFPKHWDKSRAYHRYGRKQEWLAEWNTRFKNIWLHKQLLKRNQINKIYDIEFINAIVYGGWDFNAVINPAMRYNWAYLKKDEFLKGKRPFV